jgi:hypothetical protein
MMNKLCEWTTAFLTIKKVSLRYGLKYDVSSKLSLQMIWNTQYIGMVSRLCELGNGLSDFEQ